MFSSTCSLFKRHFEVVFYEVDPFQVGTNPTETKSVGMLHIEGGWGKEINNPQDPVERKRGLDKLKGITYPPAIERMIPVATRPIEQNNSGVPA
jgi:hypothetical protein